jgi:O-antigen ligase
LLAWLANAAVVLILLAFPTGAFMGSLPLTAGLAAIAVAAVALLARPAPAAAAPTPAARALPWAAFAMLLLVALTMLPLPTAIAPVSGPLRTQQNRAAADTIASAEGLELMPPAHLGFALTRNKSGTARWALTLATAFAVAFLSSRLSPRGKHLFLRALVAVGVLVATAGYIGLHVRPQGNTLWWIYPVPDELPGPMACFRNHNHFAGFVAILIPIALALFAHDLARRRPLRALLDLLAFAIMGLGMVAALSRGAILATAAGLAICVLAFLCLRRWTLAALMILVAAAALAALLYAPHPALRERLDSLRDVRATTSYQARTTAWRDALSVFSAYPTLGVGANGFMMLYPLHRTSAHGGQRTHAENEYVQWLVDGGILGSLLAIALLIIAARATASPAPLSPPSPRDPTITVATLGAFTVVAAHAAVDYVLHIPLYTVVAASIIGLALPALPALAPNKPSPPARLPCLALAILTLLLALLYGRRLQLDSETALAKADFPTLARALAWAPTSQFAWYYLAHRIAALQTPESNLFARQCLDRAVACDPLNYRFLDQVGYARLALGDRAGAREAFAKVQQLRDWMWIPDIPDEDPKPPKPPMNADERR